MDVPEAASAIVRWSQYRFRTRGAAGVNDRLANIPVDFVGGLQTTTLCHDALMQMRLELIPLPSRDVDALKAFYVERVGFHLDHDVEPGNGMRVVQLTPPGSACSIVIGIGMTDPTAPPVQGIHLVVEDILAAREELAGRGVDITGVHDVGGGVFYAYFSDPDGNSWALQQISRQ